MAAIDERLQAVVPMVGGSGFILDDFPGLPGTGRARGFRNVDLYNRTIDARAYWPHVKCPVLFLSASDDFHAVFDNIYRSANMIPHDNWRSSQLTHYNHALGPQQWILLNHWFNRYLKRQPRNLPKTAKPTLEFGSGHRQHSITNIATFTIRPDRAEQVEQPDIYSSHAPNARARFWKHAQAKRDSDTWRTALPIREAFPLYAFADVTYPLARPVQSFRGEAASSTITSDEAIYIPDVVRAHQFRADARHIGVFDEFDKNGLRDWPATPQNGISTYKFQDPARRLSPSDHALRVIVNVPREELSYRFRISKRIFPAGLSGPPETFFANRNLAVGNQQHIILRPAAFSDRGRMDAVGNRIDNRANDNRCLPVAHVCILCLASTDRENLILPGSRQTSRYQCMVC